MNSQNETENTKHNQLVLKILQMRCTQNVKMNKKTLFSLHIFLLLSDQFEKQVL